MYKLKRSVAEHYSLWILRVYRESKHKMIMIRSLYCVLATLFTANLVQANLGQTINELEVEFGKPTLSKSVNEQADIVVYSNKDGETGFVLINGKVELSLIQQDANEFSESEVNKFLEDNKSSPDAVWRLVEQHGEEKMYRLNKGDNRVGMRSDKRVGVTSQVGLQFMNNNGEKIANLFQEMQNSAEELVKANTNNTDDAMQADVIRIGITEPKEAVLYALKKRASGHKEYSFPYFFGRVWYQRNPKDFMQWARTLTSYEFKEANECTYEPVNHIDTQDAEEYVKKEMARGPKRNLALFTIGYKKCQLDPYQAIKWANTFAPDDSGYVSVISSVSTFASQKKPEETLEWVISISDKIPPYNTQENACPATCIPLDEVYKKDPEKALNQALQIKNKEIKSVECFRLAELLASQDASRFFDYLQSVTDENEKDLLITGLIHLINNKNVDYKLLADGLLQNNIKPFEEERTPPGLYVVFAVLFQKWGKENKNDCIEFIQSVKTTTSKGALMKNHVVAALKAGVDPYKKISK